MGIACITIFCNESFRISKWIEYYSQYKNAISEHIIIDNNSDANEAKKLGESFPESKIITLPYNGGVTAAYNAGVREALKNTQIDAIMLICNDIKISAESVRRMYAELKKKKHIGMVTPVLLNKDSSVISDGGCIMNYFLFMNPQHVGEKYKKDIFNNDIVTAVTGGINLGSRAFYETVDPQDEKLFMYSDEIDVAIQAKRHGFSMRIVTDACAWHQHENAPNFTRRSYISDYLMARNKVYLAKKYYGTWREIMVLLYILVKQIARIVIYTIERKDRKPCIYSLRGIHAALKKQMGTPNIK